LSVDSVYKITPRGDVSNFYKGLGRPQGLAFDLDGNLYVAASYSGRRGIVRISPDSKASMAIAGQGLVGLAFAPGRSVILASNNAVHRLNWDVNGKVLASPEI
jgi:sugar lactone lactonase YvrE